MYSSTAARSSDLPPTFLPKLTELHWGELHYRAALGLRLPLSSVRHPTHGLAPLRPAFTSATFARMRTMLLPHFEYDAHAACGDRPEQSGHRQHAVRHSG